MFAGLRGPQMVNKYLIAIECLQWSTKKFRSCLGFLCPLSANRYGIDFLSFTISDYDTKKVIFEVGRDNPAPQDMSLDFSSIGEDVYRKIRYDFSEDVLRLPFVQTT